jgi:hypothetical protein
MLNRIALLLIALLLGSARLPAWGTPISFLAERPVLAMPGASQTSDPGQLCRRAVLAAGHAAGVPEHLMSAIARVESGRRGADGQINPWPWSINAEGVDHVYETREQAIAAVRQLQAQGMRSIDIGCMQVNLMHHPHAFSSLEQAFDPVPNAEYAARFLVQLYGQTGSWPKAVADYHSATPELGAAYQRQVMAVLGEEAGRDVALLGHPPGGAERLGIGLADAGAARYGEGARMLGNRSEAARMIPMTNAAAASARRLKAYRAAPVRVAGSGN